jgi:hypothetical protein
MTRPEPGEYAPYFARYIDLVPGDDLLVTLPAQSESTLAFWESLSEEDSFYRPTPERWSLKQLLNHLNDTERIFGYRALRIARGDTTPLPSFEQDSYARSAWADRLEWADLVEEYSAVRQATLTLFHSLRPEDYTRMGTVSDNPMSARAAAYIVGGHELYHLDIVSRDYLA